MPSQADWLKDWSLTPPVSVTMVSFFFFSPDAFWPPSSFFWLQPARPASAANAPTPVAPVTKLRRETFLFIPCSPYLMWRERPACTLDLYEKLTKLPELKRKIRMVPKQTAMANCLSAMLYTTSALSNNRKSNLHHLRETSLTLFSSKCFSCKRQIRDS